MRDQTARGAGEATGAPGGRPVPREQGRDRSPRGNWAAAPSCAQPGAGAAVVGVGGLLQACSSGTGTSPGAGGSTQDIVIGFIHPLTGALADFGRCDSWIVSTIMATPQYQNGFKAGGTTYPVTIRSYDTESSPARAGRLASAAILTDKVDLIVTSSTPELVNPVATVAENLGTPTICGNVPWQTWYANLGGNPAPGKSTVKPTWVTLYSLGVNDLCSAFIPMWNKINGQLGTDMTVAGMFPDDPDGNAFRSAWPAFAGPARYTLVDPPYPAGLTSYSSFIGEFKGKNCEFFTNVQLPRDFNAFWKQAARQGYRPKLATVAKAVAFPSDATALGSLARNIATGAWWTPNMPWQSSLTGQTCAQLAAAFTAATGSPWLQSLSNYSLFEVAYAAMTSVNNPHDRTEVADALFKVKIEGIAGQLNWTAGQNPAPGVVDTPCVGGQWKPDAKYGWSMEVVDNTLMPEVPLTGTLEPTSK